MKQSNHVMKSEIIGFSGIVRIISIFAIALGFIIGCGEINEDNDGGGESTYTDITLCQEDLSQACGEFCMNYTDQVDQDILEEYGMAHKCVKRCLDYFDKAPKEEREYDINSTSYDGVRAFTFCTCNAYFGGDVYGDFEGCVGSYGVGL
jgi:hypothetical protein